jgi:peptidoglycan/xylan/chitin deacetylase (PgdA/CDA1 family)
VSVGIGIAVAAAVIVALILVDGRTRRAPTMEVTVAGRPVDVTPGSSLGSVVSRLALHPPAGDLLDVHGKVLRPGAIPGGFLVDGRPASAQTILRKGARIAVVAGKNRTEPVTRSIVRVAGGLPSDPQFFVDRVPGEELIERGAISHELVSTRFRASGAARPERAVALTFDDGPSPQYTPRILAELRKLHVHATFFVIGYLASAHPTLVRREARMGMAVGNHSYNHPEVPPFAGLPAPLIRDEIGLADQVLARLGIQARLFRPPGGGSSAKLVRIAQALGQRVVLWSVDPTDWEPGLTGAEIAQRVLSAVRPGSIVDLHDGGGDRSATLAALPKIVRGIRARHLKLVVVPGGTTPVVAPSG